jgi:hypothetical protein
MYKIKCLLTFILSITLLSGCAIFNRNNLKPTDLERIAAVKDLMNSSIYKAVRVMSQMNSANPDSSLPPEIATVLRELRNVGLVHHIDPVLDQLSNINNVMLEEMQEIMLEAVKQVRINDAAAIIFGGQDAATLVLRNNMRSVARDRYSDRINILLDNSDVNTYWPIAAQIYNTFALGNINTNLGGFLSERAVDAFFELMGQQEHELRNEPRQIGTDVAVKVFEYYQHKQENR